MGHLRELARRYGLKTGLSTEGLPEYRGYFVDVQRRDEPSDWHGVGHGVYEANVKDKHGYSHGRCRAETDEKATKCAKRIIDAICGD